MSRRFQFSLKMILGAMLAVAIACIVWIWLPTAAQQGFASLAVLTLLWLIQAVFLFAALVFIAACLAKR